MKRWKHNTSRRYGSYSFKQNFDAIARSGGEPQILVRSGTSLVTKDPSAGEELRNKLLQDIWEAGGRSAWKKTSSYLSLEK